MQLIYLKLFRTSNSQFAKILKRMAIALDIWIVGLSNNFEVIPCHPNIFHQRDHFLKKILVKIWVYPVLIHLYWWGSHPCQYGRFHKDVWEDLYLLSVHLVVVCNLPAPPAFFQFHQLGYSYNLSSLVPFSFCCQSYPFRLFSFYYSW